jgi:NAD(P)H-hydrate repair Nnr-like enzyme with NAD(P)H-hydrate dehydratase domain
VLTPHPLEAARLLGSDVAAVQADRLLAARTLAQRHRSMVLLKGSGSVIALPDGDLVINPTGNGLLATGGTGDVLAGWTGGFWATGGDARRCAVSAPGADRRRVVAAVQPTCRRRARGGAARWR